MPMHGEVHRADLSRALQAMGYHGGLADAALDDNAREVALMFGFVMERRPAPMETREPEPPRAPAPDASSVPLPPPPPPPPTQPLEFWAVEQVETLSDEEARRRVARPEALERARRLEREDLTWSGRPPRGRPLMPWARLWPFLKEVLGRRVAGSQPDLRKVLRAMERGRPLQRLPRLPRRGWHPEVEVWRDRRAELSVFWGDLDGLTDRLGRMRGRAGLRVRSLVVDSGSATGFCTVEKATRAELRLPSSDALVLVLGDLGQYGGEATTAPWLRLGRQLRRRDIVPRALCPCPRDRWSPAMARVWNAVEWDRGSTLPRDGRGHAATPIDAALAEVRRRESMERLHDLTAPAINVEAGLLRDLRLLLPATEADVGTEHDLMVAHGGADHVGFGRDPFVVRDLRARMADESPEWLREVIRCVRRHHAHCAHVMGHMEVMGWMSALSPAQVEDLVAQGILTTQELDEARQFTNDLARTVTDAEAAENSAGLRGFGGRDADRMRTASLRDHVALQVLYALHHRQDATLPPEIDPKVIAFLDGRSETQTARVIGTRDGLVFGSQNLPSCTHMDSAADHCRVRLWDAEGRQLGDTRQFPWAEQRRLEAAELEGVRRIEVVSDARTLWMAPVQRPYWAERVWQDHAGMHAALEAAAGGIQFYWDSEPDDAALARPDAQRVRARWTVSGTVDWADHVWVDAWGVAADFHVGGVRFVLRWIPRGRFWMGSPEDEPGRFEDEGPRHEVVLTSGYWMGETPVTQTQWEAVVRTGREEPGFLGRLRRSAEGLPAAPSGFQGHPHRPVERVSWDQCESWLNLLTRARSGPLEFQLPTEAQWERACRAGTDGAFGDGSPCIVPEGNDPALDRMGWFRSNSGRETHPVGEKVPNGWGLRDMHGNVWEWCADGKRPYAEGSVRDPLGPAGDASRVVRGGSWNVEAWGCRSAYRFDGPRVDRWNSLGFRLLAGLKAGAAEPPGAERPGAPEGRSRGGAAGGRDAGPFVAA